jgi:alpha-L-arabinofuranosidase
MNISSEQLKTLMNHRGYGVGNEDPDKVRILIVGNESGIGNASNVEEFIKDLEGKAFLKKRNSENGRIHSLFLQFTSRIVRALEGKSGNWFAPKDQCDVWEEIVNNHFYSETAQLVDIRPLPRPNESMWPYKNIQERNYLNGFKNLKSKDEFVQKLINQKVQSIQEQIRSYKNLKYIIAPGAASMKKKFLELVFPEMQFTGIEIKTSKKTMIYHICENQKIKILVCPFFDSKNGIGYEGLLSAYLHLKK